MKPEGRENPNREDLNTSITLRMTRESWLSHRFRRTINDVSIRTDSQAAIISDFLQLVKVPLFPYVHHGKALPDWLQMKVAGLEFTSYRRLEHSQFLKTFRSHTIGDTVTYLSVDLPQDMPLPRGHLVVAFLPYLQTCTNSAERIALMKSLRIDDAAVRQDASNAYGNHFTERAYEAYLDYVILLKLFTQPARQDLFHPEVWQPKSYQAILGMHDRNYYQDYYSPQYSSLFGRADIYHGMISIFQGQSYPPAVLQPIFKSYARYGKMYYLRSDLAVGKRESAPDPLSGNLALQGV